MREEGNKKISIRGLLDKKKIGYFYVRITTITTKRTKSPHFVNSI